MLTLDRVARHLLGDQLPGLNPQGVAPRGWDWTRFVAIDVDQTWSLIEAMARQSWRAPLDRWLLLADPFTLPYDLDHRRCCLIAEYRLQRTPPGRGRRFPRRHRRPISTLW